MEEKKVLEGNPLKEYIKEILYENLQNFQLVVGGEQRTIGDLIENKVADILFESNSDLITEKRKSRSKKSIEDVTIMSENITYYIDPKTHNINSNFSMPNLTSIDKIKKLFSSENKELLYVMVDYFIENQVVIISNINVFFIWELDISCLGVGALGKGQLQIKNANKKIVFSSEGKKNWYLNFKKLVQNFLKKQIKKTEKQIIEWQ
jgi:hypothetical protein